MKKQIYRVMSGLCAAMLLVPSLALTAFAADPVPYTNTLVTSGQTVAASVTANFQDVFYYALTTTPTAEDTATTITGFEPTVDWLVFDAPAGTTVSVGTAATGDADKVFLTDSTNTKKQILTVSGIASTRIIGTTTPILRDISVAGLTNGKVEKGNKVILTANVSTYDGKAAATPTVVTWSSGATGTAVLTVDTSTLALGKHTYTATLGTDSKSVTIEVIACPATLTSVAINSSAGNTVNVTSAKDITFTATPTFSGCTLPSGSTHTKTAAVSWSHGGLPVGVSMKENVLSIAAELPTGTHTIAITATAVDNTISKSTIYTLILKKDAVCTATLTGVTVTGQNQIDVKDQITTKQFSALAVFDKAIADCGGQHTGANAATHDQAVSYTWSVTPTIAGVSIGANGLLSIDRTKLPVGKSDINVTATAKTVEAKLRTGAGAGVSGTTSVTLTNTTTCTVAVDSIIPTSAITEINADTTPTTTFTATVNYSSVNCNDVGHNANGVHRGVKWTVAAPDGTALGESIKIDSDTGVLTINKTLMPNPTMPIAVTATVTLGTNVISQAQNVTVKKTVAVCNKVIHPDVLKNPAYYLGAVTPDHLSIIPSTSQLVNESKRTIFAVRSNTTGTVTFTLGADKPIFTGECGYEKIGQPCPTAVNHTITWTLKQAAAGIKLEPVTATLTSGKIANALLTVDEKALAHTETAIEIIATGGGKSVSGYIVVHKGYYSPPSSGSSADREEERREAQYDKIENQIEDADRKDIIKATLTDNPNFPTRIMRGLQGQDVNLELYVGNGFTWRINGKNLNKIPDYQLYISMEVKKIKDSDISSKAKDHDIKIIELGHTGSFYGTYNLQVDAGSDYAKKTVYLYKHLDNSSKLSYKGAAKVDSDGYVSFPFTSASTYVMTDRALYGETASTLPSGGGGSTTTPTAPTIPSASVTPSAPPSSSSSEISSEPSSEISSSSSDEPSKPADVEPEEDEKPEKKKTKIPIIVPILIVVVTITVVAVVLLAKGGGMNVG